MYFGARPRPRGCGHAPVVAPPHPPQQQATHSVTARLAQIRSAGVQLLLSVTLFPVGNVPLLPAGITQRREEKNQKLVNR